MDLETYLEDPCRASSLPWCKAASICVPPHMRIIHDSRFRADAWPGWKDEPYFRLIHRLEDIPKPEESFTAIPAETLAAHIALCYDDLRASPTQLATEEDLRIAICRDGQIVASGIAQLDRDIGEGTLEWIQVSPDCRGQGLGKAIVWELLRRLQKRARFVTVSGKVHNPTNPEQLYRSCGFAGNDVWHILTKQP